MALFISRSYGKSVLSTAVETLLSLTLASVLWLFGKSSNLLAVQEMDIILTTLRRQYPHARLGDGECEDITNRPDVGALFHAAFCLFAARM